MAQVLEFPPYLQEPIEAGLLTHHQAWRLDYELTELQHQPWTPGVQEINRMVSMFYMQTEAMTRH